MAKLVLALWRRPEIERGDFQERVLAKWARPLLEQSDIAGLALHQLDPALNTEPLAAGGTSDAPPDAVTSLWVGDGAPASLRSRVIAARNFDGVGRLEAWRVEEFRPRRYERSWADGARSPGFANVSLLHPAPGASHAACIRHWRERHTPLALRIHVGLWNYVQNPVLECLTETGRDVFGIGELHFRSQADMRDRLFDSEAGRVEIFEDIPRFMSLDRTRAANMTETVLRTPRPEPAGAP